MISCPPPIARASRNSRKGFTLVEGIIALTIAGVLLTAVVTQIVESATLSLRITRTLEHSRNAREMIDRLSADIRAAQIMRLYPSFADRAHAARDGQSGNYLVLQQVGPTGIITRTIGYYATTLRNDRGWALYRHDSGNGEGDALPASHTEGQHLILKRGVRLPDSNHLFRCVRDRGVSIEGEFGAPDTDRRERTEFIRCTLFTRS